MATLALKINDKPVEKSPATLELWFAVMSTANPAAKGVTSAVAAALAKNPKYIDLFRAGGNPAESIVILEDGKPAAEFTRSQLAEKMVIAANVKNWQGQIFTEKGGKKSATDKGDLEV